MSQHLASPPFLHRHRVVWIGAAIAAVAALLVVVVLPSEPDSPDPNVLPVSMIDNAFVPSELHATPGQSIEVTNDGDVTHSMLIVGLGKGVELATGNSLTFDLPAKRTGEFEVICDIPGHQEAGMVATLTISDASVEAPVTVGE